MGKVKRMSNETSMILSVLLLGFVAGILSGMFGIGGGLVIVPGLMILFQMPLNTATGTSLFALIWPVGLLGVLAYWREGQVNARIGGWIAVGLFVGAYLGAKVTLSFPPSTMKRAYAVFLLVVGAYFLYSTKSSPARTSAPPSTAPAPGGGSGSP